MNKQPRMIDADKLLEWMEESGQANGFWGGTTDDSHRAFDNLTDAIALGKLNSDPIPLPTIKPGDKVKHSDLGQVRIMSEPLITVLKDKDQYEVYLSDLELIPNE